MFFCDTKVQKIHETTKYKDNKIVLNNDNYDNKDNYLKATTCRLFRDNYKRSLRPKVEKVVFVVIVVV